MCRHHIFERPQDLDVIVWTLDDHPCSRSFWVPEGLGCAPCLRISQLVCFVLGYGPRTCGFAFEGRVWLVGHPHTPSAMAWFHRPCFLAIGHKFWPDGTFVGRSALSLVDRPYFWAETFLSTFCRNFLPAVTVGGHNSHPPYTCMEGFVSILKLVEQAWELKFYKKGASSPFPEVLKIEIAYTSSISFSLYIQPLSLVLPWFVLKSVESSYYCTKTPSRTPSFGCWGP